MKRTHSAGIILLIAVLVALVAGCTASPKSRTNDFAKLLPGEAGEWERDDDQTVKLVSSTVTSKGHVSMFYEGPGDAIAYIVVEVHSSEDAAEVAAADREREWTMQGLTIDRDRAPQKATAVVTFSGRARWALFQEQEIVVEIDVLAADEETLVSDEAFDALMTMVRNAYVKVLEDSE